jgi:hypothetical protein
MTIQGRGSELGRFKVVTGVFAVENSENSDDSENSDPKTGGQK